MGDKALEITIADAEGLKQEKCFSVWKKKYLIVWKTIPNLNFQWYMGVRCTESKSFNVNDC